MEKSLIFSLFIINLFIKKTLENNTCLYNYRSKNREYCCASFKNYTSCFYYHFLCIND